jgi:CBS domain-containing protein
MTLAQAAELLAREGISGAPVTDETGRVVGVVSEKDLLVHAQSYASLPRLTVGAGALPYSGGLGDVPGELLGDAYAAGLSAGVPDVMSFPVVSAREEDTATHLADLMLTHRLNRVPILTAEGKAVGIVTREDVLRAIVLMAAAPSRGEAPAAP